MSNSADPISLDHITYISPENIFPNDSYRYTRHTSVVRLTKRRESVHQPYWTVQEVSQDFASHLTDSYPDELTWRPTTEGAKELATLCQSQILISQSHWLTFVPIGAITDEFGGQLREIRIPIRPHVSTRSSIDEGRLDIEQRDQIPTDKGEVSFIWSYGDDTSMPGAWAVRHLEKVEGTTELIENLNESQLDGYPTEVRLEKQLGAPKRTVFWGKCIAMSALHDVLPADHPKPDGWSGLQYAKYRNSGRRSANFDLNTIEIVLLSGLKLHSA